MHFTRDPVIETIITPREGHKLVLRSTTAREGQEEFVVDMVEVISLGQQSLYRSLDRSPSFIVPISDYEIVEVREARITLKAPTIDQGIKIAGGKEPKREREPSHPPAEQKNDRRKRRGRKPQTESSAKEEGTAPAERPASVERPMMLIPPPTTLIADSLSRYKEMTAMEELALEEHLEPISQDDDPGAFN